MAGQTLIPAGDFRTTYAADTTVFPTATSRNAMIAVAVVNVSFYARGVRAAVLLLREQEFVEAARAIGSTEGRILRRHVLPGIVGPILVFVSMNIGVMITESAGLSFIGLGAQPPTAPEAVSTTARSGEPSPAR